MHHCDVRVDDYLRAAQAFAQPILSHLRELLHAQCPELRETIKWGMPFFEYHGVLCSMAAFKQHCAFCFWKHEVVGDQGSNAAMGQFGRITCLADLPPDALLITYIRRAMQINELGQKSTDKKPLKPAPRVAEIPADLGAALESDVAAAQAFAQLAPSHRREYIDWLNQAKRPETRQRRLAQTLSKLSQSLR